jgi:hypothetical protein
MALVIDKRAAVAGPGVHALIVGVSDYLNLPAHDDPPVEGTWFLNKLTSAALSAFKTYECVRQSRLALPLKTVRLLLSPSAVEVAAEPALGTAGASRASRAAFEKFALEWREDAKSNPDDMTILYFSGHGMQRGPEEGVLLLEDFLAPGASLAKCFEIGNIRNGMAPSDTYPNIALTQFYFIDACLTRQETQKKFVNPQVPDVFDTELNRVDKRQAPMLFSTIDGAIALGRVGKPSHFAEALTLALQRAAEEPDQDLAGNTFWPITSLTIKNALDLYYAKHKLGTNVKMGGVVGLPVIRKLPGPPEVEISVQVQPDSLGNPYGIWLYDDGNIAVPQCNPTQQTQFEITVKAGLYRVQVDSPRLQSNPYRSQLRFITQRVPRPWLHNIESFLKPTP